MKKTYILFLLILISALYAEDKKKLFKYSGNIGARMESNISELNYIPDNYAATYFNINLSAGLIGLNLNGELSTSEKRFSPEFIKQLSISPTIGFLRMDIGDHYPRYSKFVMSGSKVRGISFLMNPKNFIFGMTGGRVRVGGADKDGEYRREAYGMQLGMKSKKFELITKFSRLNDLPSKIDSIFVPQESLTAGISTKIKLPGKIKIQGEAGYSFHTRDKTAEKLDSALSYKGFELGDIGLSPRLSSRVDYAYNYNIYIPVKFFQFVYQKDFIGPGFQTLGTPYLKNDIQKDLYRANINLFKGKFYSSVIYLTQKNNLNSELTNQTVMDNYSVSTRIRPFQYFSINGRFSTLSREKKDSLQSYTYDKNAFSITPEFKFKTGELNHRMSMTYGSSISEYNNDEFKTINFRARYVGSMDNGYSINADMNKNDYGKTVRNYMTIGATKKFNQKGNISANLGFGDKTESTISAFMILPWKFRMNTSFSYFRMSRYSFRYRINIVRNF